MVLFRPLNSQKSKSIVWRITITPLIWVPVLLLTTAISKYEATTITAEMPFSLASTPDGWVDTAGYQGLDSGRLIVNFSIEMGFCDAGEHRPKVQESSCLGRCQQRGSVNYDTAACSCDLWCDARGTCCNDFYQRCPYLYWTYMKNFTTLGLSSMCDADGVSVVSSCSNVPPLKPDLGKIKKFISKASSTLRRPQDVVNFRPGSDRANLNDLLGGPPLKIRELYVRDAFSNLVFKNRDVFHSCRPPNAVPLNVGRKIDLVCSEKADIDILTQVLTPKDDRTQLNKLKNYLQGCRVHKIRNEGLTKFDECYNPASINCVDTRGQETWDLFSDLCPTEANASSPSWSYAVYPDLIMSTEAKYVAITDDLHCFYKFPNIADVRVRRAFDASLTIQAKPWYTRMTKQDHKFYPIKPLDGEERYIEDQGFWVSISIFSISRAFFLDCETLDTSLQNCQSLEPEDFQMRLKVLEAEDSSYKGVSLWSYYSLGAAVQRVGSTYNSQLNPASVHQHGIPMCSCLRVQMAFTRLDTLTARIIFLQGDKCVFQLKPNLGMTPRETPTFKALLDFVEDSKGELELSLNQSKNFCEQDHLTVARFCLYPITKTVLEPPSSARQLRCLQLDLTGRDQKFNSSAMRIDGNGYDVVTIGLSSMVLLLLQV